MRNAVLVGALVAGCSLAPPHPRYVEQPTSALVAVDSPPPPARVEVLPARPSPEAVWVDGEWVWRRGLWAWLRGRWVVAPRGASFSAWTVVRRADGTLWHAPGAWRDAAGKVVDPPEPLAIANVQAGAVVDAEGDVEPTGPILRERPRSASSASPGSSPAPGSSSVAAGDGGPER